MKINFGFKGKSDFYLYRINVPSKGFKTKYR